MLISHCYTPPAEEMGYKKIAISTVNISTYLTRISSYIKPFLAYPV